MGEVLVIGGGFGGIASALRFRAKGYKVTLVDRCSKLGGRAQVYHRDGFTFDAGPTVITAPFLFDELFELFGKNAKDYFRLVPLDPWYQFYFNDGTTFNGVKYKGVKLFNGKKMLVFETKANKQLTINPSFHTFTLEKKDKE